MTAQPLHHSPAQELAPAHDWQFYLSPVEAWDAMYEDCMAATQSIEMEQYIVHNDDAGRKFMRMFVEKAKQGVRVRLLLDEVGSGSLRHSPLLADFRAGGGILRFYNSLKLIDLLKPRRVFPRTHLKALAIDGKIAYVGGVCIAQRMANWRDTQIRVSGPVVEQVRRALDRNMKEEVDPQDEHHRPPHVPKDVPDPEFSYIQNDPAFFRHPIYYEILRQIGRARKFVYISSAFFVPTRRLRRYLKNAAAAGAEVVILIPQKSDSHLADWACLSYMATLLRGGVRVFHYLPSVLHTKTMVVDGDWGTVGSCNMDPLSFFHNREANLIVSDEDVLAEMKRDFLADLERGRELTWASLKQTPLRIRLAGHFARLWRPFL